LYRDGNLIPIAWEPSRTKIPKDRSIVLIFRHPPLDGSEILQHVVRIATQEFTTACMAGWLSDNDLVLILLPNEEIRNLLDPSKIEELTSQTRGIGCSSVLNFKNFLNKDNISSEEEIESIEETEEECFYGFCCLRGLKCRYSHSVDEKRFFLEHGAGVKGYKGKRCLHDLRGNCRYSSDPVLCPWAHSENEARCYYCTKGVGHYAETCPFRNIQESIVPDCGIRATIAGS